MDVWINLEALLSGFPNTMQKISFEIDGCVLIIGDPSEANPRILQLELAKNHFKNIKKPFIGRIYVVIDYRYDGSPDKPNYKDTTQFINLISDYEFDISAPLQFEVKGGHFSKAGTKAVILFIQ